ncbi:protein FAR1-RELATED SEQUENCE 5-like [Helianthus annuus]|uniref:protein FAR1-RELATED SEQUENCE 5-like n=1 Tax=Helianthus annuus TaxID=4232 RepID=UPI001652DF48|nr:protein FAR1-RELATED SEQUENCE 5-like [Helianthus annuus]
MDPQSSTGRNTDVEFEDARSVGDQVQLSAYQRVTIGDVLNPNSTNPNANTNTSGVNECSNDERLYIPEVEASATPVVGMQFTSLEQAYVFYQTYAKLAGFSTRKGGEVHSGGITKTKYIVCSKEGHKPLFIDDAYSKSKNPFKSRNRGTIRTGCKAQLMICLVDGRSYTVKKFVDGHNHKFVCPHHIHMLPAYRQLSDVQEEMIWELGTLNLGPVKAFHIMSKRYGGFENVDQKREYLVDFSFEYSVDEDKQLTSLFWADGLCKHNFMEFGDVISFDSTFKTNKYKMVFVPFTGIDNHCRNVTLGAGLLASESIDSYKWLLNSFVKSFERQPKVLVTDQDPTMKQDIEGVFTTSRYRLCMWHIMKKGADKVGHELCNNDGFKRKMCDIVWTDSIEPKVRFKNLEEDRWTKDVVSNELNATFDVKVDAKDEQYKAKQIAREIMYTWEYLIEKDPSHKVNEVEDEDDKEEDEFEDYSGGSDDGSKEDVWEEVSEDED